MPTFQYKVRDTYGREVVGTTIATTRSDAAKELRGRNLLIFDLDEEEAPAPQSARETRVARGLWSPSGGAVELALRQIGVMLRSGLTLIDSIQTAARQSSSKRLRSILLVIVEDIRAGMPLQEAIQPHACFNRLTQRLVEAGELTGELDLVLIRAADAMERRRILRTKMASAMLYPGVVLLAAIGATLFMLTFAIPRISDYLAATGRELPGMTQFLVDASDFLMVEWPSIVVGIVATLLALMLVYKTEPGRHLIDRIMLRVPLLGLILRIGATASLSRILEIMVRSGISIVESLQTAERLHRNAHIQTILARARETVLQGEPLAPALVAPGGLTPMLGSMVAVGEQSGTLEQVLGETAEYHENRLSSLVQLLSTVVEVTVVVVVGTIVGFVYIAFMIALYHAAQP